MTDVTIKVPPETEGNDNCIIGEDCHAHGDRNLIIGHSVGVYGNDCVIVGRNHETFRGDKLFILGVRDINELMARVGGKELSVGKNNHGRD